jgi:rhodanese-related sulfurtransferase
MNIQTVNPNLRFAREQGRALGLRYAGAVGPDVACDVLAAGGALLVDVRTAEELKRVGSIPGAIHIAWQTGPALIKNPRFFKELSAAVPRDATVFFICRSGKRSGDAAAAAVAEGYHNAYNILEGFEGGPDAKGEAGPGWRRRGLPVNTP